MAGGGFGSFSAVLHSCSDLVDMALSEPSRRCARSIRPGEAQIMLLGGAPRAVYERESAAVTSADSVGYQIQSTATRLSMRQHVCQSGRQKPAA